MDHLKKIIGDLEVHDVEGIRACFQNGVSPNELYNGEPLFNELTGGYLRGPKFRECVRAFVEYGLQFEDKVLLSTLLEDADSLKKYIEEDPDLIRQKFSLRCAFTPLEEASLLHICAEFNHVECARVLVAYGADVDAKAGTDEHGFGGHTPIFHTVNQNQNRSAEMMELLLQHSCDLKIQVKGLIWGKSFDWETLVPAVNPISYAMMGLLPQMHRKEAVIAGIVEKLMHEAFGINYKCRNIPNSYLKN